MFDGRWRSSVERGLKPVGSGLRRTGLQADHLTALGLIMAAVCAVAIGSGRLGAGLVLLALAAIPDALDGAVAKASGTASPRGAFFDSVADRVTDSLLLGGIAWYLAGVDGGHAAMLPFAVLGTSTLISYERAKAESLGYTARGGLMERAERILLMGFALAFSRFMVPVLWVMLVLTSFTAVQRFVKVWVQASAPRPERRWRALREWREWREGRLVDELRWPSTSPRWRARRQPRERPTSVRAWRRRAGTRP